MESLVSDKILQFFTRYPAKHFDKQQVLVRAGEAPPGIMHLVSGQVRQYDIAANGDEAVVNVFKPPAFFPMSWAVTGTPNRYFFETVTAVELRQAPPDDVVTFLRQNSDVMFDLLARLYSGVEGMQRRMAHLMGGNARSRVLYELIVQGKRFGVEQHEGSYRLALHEDELAKRAGLSRETMNRELMALKMQGLVNVAHKALILTDLSKLEAELGENL